MSMKTVPASARHRRLRDELMAGLQTRFGDVSAEELLAVTCQLVGMMIAMQDQRRFSNEQVLQLVQANIEVGNRDVVKSLLGPAEGRA